MAINYCYIHLLVTEVLGVRSMEHSFFLIVRLQRVHLTKTKLTSFWKTLPLAYVRRMKVKSSFQVLHSYLKDVDHPCYCWNSNLHYFSPLKRPQYSSLPLNTIKNNRHETSNNNNLESSPVITYYRLTNSQFQRDNFRSEIWTHVFWTYTLRALKMKPFQNLK